MKIATVSDDGKTISQHFGRAATYVVITVEDGSIVGRETRQKPGHRQFAAQEQAQAAASSAQKPAPVAPAVVHTHTHAANQPHGFQAGAADRHNQMAAVIADCEALLSRGMGMGAYKGLEEFGIKPVVTDIPTIDEAALAYANGSIVDHIEKLH
jgi:predicted Fe-Mo cluster-binding NifX family protein